MANPVSAIAFRPLNQLVHEADRRLELVEGHSLEKLAGQLYEERSRHGIGDFPLTERIQGYWDRSTVELDLVAVNETEKIIRFGSCKRSCDKLIPDITNFEQHIARFLDVKRSFQSWTVQKVGISTELNSAHRAVLRRHDIIPQDLRDLTADLPT